MPNLSEFMNSSSGKLATIKRRARASYLPKRVKVNKTNLFRYSNFVSKKFKINFHNDFNELWKWSINNKIDFWESVWNFTKIKGNFSQSR